MRSLIKGNIMANQYNLKERIDLFERNYTQYKSGQYYEANTRVDFIDPFFSLLEWDIANNQGYHNDKTVHIILPRDTVKSQIDLRYVLALFNSKLLNYFYQIMTEEIGRAFAQVKTINVKNLPFIIPNKTKHDDIVSLVDKMLELKVKEANEPNQQLKTMIARQIEGVDKAIDIEVYKLYNLSEEDIKVVENSG